MRPPAEPPPSRREHFSPRTTPSIVTQTHQQTIPSTHHIHPPWQQTQYPTYHTTHIPPQHWGPTSGYHPDFHPNPHTSTQYSPRPLSPQTQTPAQLLYPTVPTTSSNDNTHWQARQAASPFDMATTGSIHSTPFPQQTQVPPNWALPSGYQPDLSNPYGHVPFTQQPSPPQTQFTTQMFHPSVLVPTPHSTATWHQSPHGIIQLSALTQDQIETYASAIAAKLSQQISERVEARLIEAFNRIGAPSTKTHHNDTGHCQRSSLQHQIGESSSPTTIPLTKHNPRSSPNSPKSTPPGNIAFPPTHPKLVEERFDQDRQNTNLHNKMNKPSYDQLRRILRSSNDQINFSSTTFSTKDYSSICCFHVAILREMADRILLQQHWQELWNRQETDNKQFHWVPHGIDKQHRCMVLPPMTVCSQAARHVQRLHSRWKLFNWQKIRMDDPVAWEKLWNQTWDFMRHGVTVYFSVQDRPPDLAWNVSCGGIIFRVLSF